MKYISLDIETTGLDPAKNQVLQVAMVIDEITGSTIGDLPVDDLPVFEGLVWHERITGDPEALAMNVEVIEALASVRWLTPEPVRLVVNFRGRVAPVYRSMDDLVDSAVHWIRVHFGIADGDRRRVPVAGKNAAGFDVPFLPDELTRLFHHRVIDVGSVALGSPDLRHLWDEDHVSGLGALHDGPITHDSVDDARVVVKLLRKILR